MYGSTSSSVLHYTPTSLAEPGTDARTVFVKGFIADDEPASQGTDRPPLTVCDVIPHRDTAWEVRALLYSDNAIDVSNYWARLCVCPGDTLAIVHLLDNTYRTVSDGLGPTENVSCLAVVFPSQLAPYTTRTACLVDMIAADLRDQGFDLRRDNQRKALIALLGTVVAIDRVGRAPMTRYVWTRFLPTANERALALRRTHVHVVPRLRTIVCDIPPVSTPNAGTLYQRSVWQQQ